MGVWDSAIPDITKIALLVTLILLMTKNQKIKLKLLWEDYNSLVEVKGILLNNINDPLKESCLDEQC